MARLGRRKLPDEERRTAGALNIRFNQQEWIVVETKAAAAGVTPTEWARLAALGRNPPARPLVPELNQEAWRELARLAAAVNGAIWRFRPGAEDGLRTLLEDIRQELAGVRNRLKGGAE